jgi:hypothetical protein
MPDIDLIRHDTDVCDPAAHHGGVEAEAQQRTRNAINRTSCVCVVVSVRRASSHRHPPLGWQTSGWGVDTQVGRQVGRSKSVVSALVVLPILPYSPLLLTHLFFVLLLLLRHSYPTSAPHVPA